jgi:tetratricopeptide (TPR) repeat protein
MLFIDRAKRIDPNFKVGNREIKIIADIVELVSGLPLGIELAAAGIKRYSLAELRDFIAGDSSFLKTDQPELPERQRSLISVFNAFWNQLSEDERIVMRRLAVFRGVVTQASAQKIASASPFFLGSLVSRGFLQRKMPQGYIAHSMHRRFVYEKLMENKEDLKTAHIKHRDYFFSYINKLERDIRDNPQKELLDEIEVEYDNIRAAISFTIQSKDEQKAIEFCELMMRFWKIRGYYEEGYYWLNQTFELNTNANLVMKSAALCAAAKLVTALGDYDKAMDYSNRSLKLATDLGDQHGVARALNSLGASVASSGDIKRAETYFAKSLEIYRNLRVQQAIAGTLVHIADMEIQNKNLDQARTFLDEALITFRTVGDNIGIVHVLQSYAKIHIIRNQFVEAYGQLLESMEIAWRLQARDELVNNYLLLAEYHSNKSDPENAVCLLALVDDLTERYKISLKVDDKKDYKIIKAHLLKELKREKFDKLWIKAKTISEIQMISKYS